MPNYNQPPFKTPAAKRVKPNPEDKSAGQAGHSHSVDTPHALRSLGDGMVISPVSKMSDEKMFLIESTSRSLDYAVAP